MKWIRPGGSSWRKFPTTLDLLPFIFTTYDTFRGDVEWKYLISTIDCTWTHYKTNKDNVLSLYINIFLLSNCRNFWHFGQYGYVFRENRNPITEPCVQPYTGSLKLRGEKVYGSTRNESVDGFYSTRL